jgi:hypothetical protein
MRHDHDRLNFGTRHRGPCVQPALAEVAAHSFVARRLGTSSARRYLPAVADVREPSQTSRPEAVHEGS